MTYRYSGKFAAADDDPEVQESRFNLDTSAIETDSKTLVNDLIQLAVDGGDPNEIMQEAYLQIHEGSAGPYPIGSTVRVNQAWSGDGVSLSKGDVVSIVQTSLGENGTEKMVLLPDGKTKAVVPLKVLGESIGMGPSGHAVPSAKGSPSVMGAHYQGTSKTPEASQMMQPGTSGKAHKPSVFQGDKAPMDAAGAQKMGSKKPSQHMSKAVEAVFDALNDMAESGDDSTFRKMTTFMRQLENLDDAGAYAELYEMIYGEGQHEVDDLLGVLSDLSEEEKEKMPPMMKGKDMDKMPEKMRMGYMNDMMKKYRGKYADMPDEAMKMLMKYGNDYQKKMAKKYC